jgi:hypothetical protein
MAGYKKEDATSPTVPKERKFVAVAINTSKSRDVMILSIPGTFLHVLTKDEVIMLLRGTLAETMLHVDPEQYHPHITYDNKGVPILYANMNKAVYGLLRVALDIYLKLWGNLEGRWYGINPCNPCASNKTIGSTQYTVIWHVDDLKFLCKKVIVNTIVFRERDCLVGRDSSQ